MRFPFGVYYQREQWGITNDMHRVQQAWRGEERLWRVFWVYGVALSIVGVFASLAVELGTAMSSGVVAAPSKSTWFLYYHIWLAVSECYWVWLGVSLWRCAFNVKRRVWGYSARTIAVAVVIASLVQIYLYRIK
jgi:hypothetical protein